jgi:acetylornithine/N-succinyldiaminopimelate aminotransferase
MAVAKAIGGGFPLGACLATEDAAAGMVAGTHGSTYGGNPLAMAVGLAALDLIAAPEFLEHTRSAAATLRARLETIVGRFPAVFAEVRGLGLMLGLRCADGVVSGEIVGALQREGMLTVGAAENVIRLLPPLNIGDAEIAEAGATLERVAAAAAGAARAA